VAEGVRGNMVQRFREREPREKKKLEGVKNRRESEAEKDRTPAQKVPD